MLTSSENISSANSAHNADYLQVKSALYALRETQHVATISGMDIGNSIRERRKARGWTLEHLANMVGTDTGNLSRLERNKQGVSGDLLDKILSALDLKLVLATGDYRQDSPAELEPAYQPNRYNRYPVINEVQAGEWTEICEQLQLDDTVEWQATTADAGPYGFWLRVKNDSMTSPSGKSFPEGMLILVHPGLEVMPGQFTVAKLDSSNKATFKKFIQDASGHYLKPLNPSYRMIPINGDCRFVGRVIEAKWADL